MGAPLGLSSALSGPAKIAVTAAANRACFVNAMPRDRTRELLSERIGALLILSGVTNGFNVGEVAPNREFHRGGDVSRLQSDLDVGR